MKELNRKKIKEILSSEDFGNEYVIKGWVRTKRAGKKVAFITVNDGSTIDSIQVVADIEHFNTELINNISTGASVMVKGILSKSMGQEQNVEIHASEMKLYGKAEPETYPLQKKGHSMEFLREIAHLRPRTNTFGAIFRLRHMLSFAIHKYFNDRGFYYIHTPIITGSDAEGAGEMFKVTILDLLHPPRDENNQINYKEDFFGRETNLTVSGQLEAELGALALSAVYTFGPTFRAENSNTPRHLAEFWMIEPEMAFYDIHDNMDLAEDFIKYLISYVLSNGSGDLQFLQKMYDEELIGRLNFILENEFVRIAYSEGIDILKKADKKFEFPVTWGSDLQAEHERYLVEKHYKKPVIITDYPKESKAFYMKQNEDGKTVRAMDVLFPKIGEIIGGSQREEDYNKLLARIRELKMPEQNLWWYLETRKFGTVPHSGFGLGFERLLLFITGMSNIRDVIPFPRTPNNAEF